MVVDTSVWIDLLNHRRTPEAARLVRALADDEPVLVPDLVLTELLQGLQNEAAAIRIADLMSAFPAPPELETADYRRAASLYRACRAHGTTPRSTIDCIIAQVCLKFGLPMLARDRDYEVIARIAPLELVELAEG